MKLVVVASTYKHAEFYVRRNTKLPIQDVIIITDKHSAQLRLAGLTLRPEDVVWYTSPRNRSEIEEIISAHTKES